MCTQWLARPAGSATAVTGVSHEESIIAPRMRPAVGVGSMYEWRVIQPERHHNRRNGNSFFAGAKGIWRQLFSAALRVEDLEATPKAGRNCRIKAHPPVDYLFRRNA